MKQIRNLFITLILAFISIPLFSQSSLADASEECRRSVAFYNDYIKQNNFKEAAPLWRDAFRECPPGIRQSIYRDGIRIFKYFIRNNEDNIELKKSLVDSLLMMYDLRIEHFPKYASSAATYKVFDMLEYMGDNNIEILKAINRAIEISGDKTEPSLLVIAMQKLGNLYNKEKLSAEKVMEAYAAYTAIIDHQITTNTEKAVKAKTDLDNLFVSCGVANCENIVKLFTPRFDANPTDVDLANTIVSLLSNAGCTTEPLFLRTVEALYNSDPTNYVYIKNLYLLYSSKGDHENAIKMLEQAIDSDQSSDEDDANMLITLANYYLQSKEFSKAIETANEAMKRDISVSGRANLIIGLAWASVRCTGTEIETISKYWVAVDYLIKAKRADPSLANEANRYISTYCQYFPSKEDAFLFNCIDGEPYTVNCSGMRAITTVRTRK